MTCWDVQQETQEELWSTIDAKDDYINFIDNWIDIVVALVFKRFPEIIKNKTRLRRSIYSTEKKIGYRYRKKKEKKSGIYIHIKETYEYWKQGIAKKTEENSGDS